MVLVRQDRMSGVSAGAAGYETGGPPTGCVNTERTGAMAPEAAGQITGARSADGWS